MDGQTAHDVSCAHCKKLQVKTTKKLKTAVKERSPKGLVGFNIPKHTQRISMHTNQTISEVQQWHNRRSETRAGDWETISNSRMPAGKVWHRLWRPPCIWYDSSDMPMLCLPQTHTDTHVNCTCTHQFNGIWVSLLLPRSWGWMLVSVGSCLWDRGPGL